MVTSKNHSASDAQSDFSSVRLYRNFAGILSYVKKFMCKMTENLQADEVLRLKPVVFRGDHI